MSNGTTPYLETFANFSPDRTYRYALGRRFSMLSDRLLVFIGLNPSTANENQDDPTIRRCVGFAKREGCGGIVMLNLFAYISSDPAEMMRQSDPVGPDNDRIIKSFDGLGHTFVACWGHWDFADRSAAVMKLISQPMFCLGVTKDGKPKHPLYLPADARLIMIEEGTNRKGK